MSTHHTPAHHYGIRISEAAIHEHRLRVVAALLLAVIALISAIPLTAAIYYTQALAATAGHRTILDALTAGDSAPLTAVIVAMVVAIVLGTTQVWNAHRAIRVPLSRPADTGFRATSVTLCAIGCLGPVGVFLLTLSYLG